MEQNIELERGLEEAGKILVKELIKRLQSHKDTGDLINSVSFDVIQKANEYSIVLTSDKYLDNIDKGRKKGTFPNVTAITKWAKDKGIRFASEEQVGYVIARSISKKGIKPTNIVDKTINSVMGNITKIIGSSYREDLVNAINNDLNDLK